MQAETRQTLLSVLGKAGLSMAQQESALVLTGLEPEAALKVEDISTMSVTTFAQLYTVCFALHARLMWLQSAC